jgi:outer membrane protein insertion porin family
VETPAVPGSGDEVDVNVDVVEKPSGALLAGLGFSQSSGIVLNASVRQENFLGTGKKVGLAFQTSDANQNYEVSYNNPYYTVDGISRGFTLNYRTTDFDELDTADYKTDDAILGMNFGIPLSEFNKFTFGFALHHIDFELGAAPSDEIIDWQDTEGSKYLNFETTIGWSHDSRDSAIFPTDGASQRLIAELTLPGSDLTYYKVEYRHRRYFPLGDDLVLSLGGEIGYGDSYGDTSQLPFFENYFGGGPKSVRGFSTFSLGPRDSQGDPLGGNAKVIANAELAYPAPFYPESMRLLAFVDAGAVYNTDDDIFDSDELRYSSGIGMAWLSPLGALRVSYAVPFNKDSQDEPEEFQFTFGTTF